MLKMTLYGLENFLNNQNDSIFSEITLPASVDLDTLKANIMLKGGEFESLYTDPYFIKQMIKTWSIKHERTFNRWERALLIDYEPLDNYDRQESWSNNQGGTVTVAGNSTATDKVSPYDNGGFATKAQSTNEGDSTNTINTNDSHTGRVHGNIGIKTTQSILTEEVASSKLNLIDLITDLFIQEFCVLLY